MNWLNLVHFEAEFCKRHSDLDNREQRIVKICAGCCGLLPKKVRRIFKMIWKIHMGDNFAMCSFTSGQMAAVC